METKAIDGRRQAIAKRKGRPSSLDKPGAREAIVAALECRRGNIRAIAKDLHCGEITIRKWLEKNPDVAKPWRDLQEKSRSKHAPHAPPPEELSLPPAIKDPILLILKSLAEPKMEAIKILAVLVAYEKCKSWTQVAKWLSLSTRTANRYRRTYKSFEELMPYVPQTILTNTPLPTPSNESAENKEGRIFQAYQKAQEALYHIWQLLELTQTRCANASNLRKAGNCKASPDLENGCFSARLNAADARLESKRLFQEMNHFINAIDSEREEPETPEPPAETYKEGLSESRIVKAYTDGKF